MSFFKRLFQPAPPPEGEVALQPHGQPFPWVRGAKLTALEPVTIAIPAAAISQEEKIGSVVFGDADMEIRLPASSNDTLIYLRLNAGSSVSLSKSVQGVVLAEDKLPKRIRVLMPQNEKKS